jgi:dCTP diphosphatase
MAVAALRCGGTEGIIRADACDASCRCHAIAGHQDVGTVSRGGRPPAVLLPSRAADAAGVPSPMRHLTDQVVAFRDAREWSQFHGLKDEALSLLIEAGEVAEHLRWHDDATLRRRIAEDPGPIADELADVLYWTLLLAHDAGIDLEAAFARKMVENERKYPVEASRGRANKYDDL